MGFEEFRDKYREKRNFNHGSGRGTAASNAKRRLKMQLQRDQVIEKFNSDNPPTKKELAKEFGVAIQTINEYLR